jgi:PAS domain S-box-containing protein
MFTVCYLGRRTRRTDLALVLGLLLTVVFSVPLFRHQLVFNPRLDANGMVVEDMSIGGGGAAAILIAYMVGCLILFWQERHRTGELYMALSVFILLVGVVIGGVFDVPFPSMSITNALSAAILGYAVIRRQLFNPLRERTAELQREITERQRVEEVLRESEAKFRNLFEHTKDAIFLADAQTGVLIDANLAACNMLGLPREKIVGMHQSQLHPPEEVERYKAIFREHVEKGVVITEDLFVQRPDGRRIPVDISASVIELAEKSIIQGSFRDITERKRAEEEIRQRTAQLEALREVGLKLTAQLDLDALLHSIVSRAIELLGGTAGGLYLYRPDRDVLEWSVPVGSNLAPIGTILHRGEGLAGKVWETGESFAVDDYQQWEGRAAIYEDRRFRAVVGAPVRWGDEFLGVLNVLADPPGAFSSAHAEMLSLFAQQAAIAIRNVRLYDQVQARSRYLEALQQINATLRSTLPLSQVLQTITRSAGEALKYVGTLIGIPDITGERLILGSAWGGRFLDVTVKLTGLKLASFSLPLTAKDNPMAQAYLSGRFQAWSRAPERIVVGVERAISPRLARLIERAMGAKMAICVPLPVGDKVVGMLAAFSPREQLSDDERAVLLSVADQAGLAIENARLYEETHRRLEYMRSLHSIDMTITASMDLHTIFNILLDQAISRLQVDAATLLLFNPQLQTLEYREGRGFRTDALQHTSLRLGEGHAGQSASERRMVSIADLREAKNAFARAPLLDMENFVAYFAVPLIAKGQIRGVLEIFHRAPLDPNEEWLDFLDALATQAAIAVDNATLFADLQRANAELTQAYDSTLAGWAHALELRDKQTRGHTDRVAEMTLRVARAMGMSAEELTHVHRGTLLHDIGKMGISDKILQKPEPLTEQEKEIMRQHPAYAYEMLSPIAYLRRALDVPYCHHERWDGTGYPQGLKGEEIPLAARIFAVVDVWEALLSDRPYRAAWPEDKVVEYIREQAGKQFDPRVVEVFWRVLGER